jgi:3-dehydroquinate synthase
LISYTADIASSLQHAIRQGNFNKVFALTDTNTWNLFHHIFKNIIPEENHIIIPAGEQHKNLGTAELVWQELKNHHADRNSLLVNLGGGMVTDLGGFCAATYMRGIAFMQIPTTLLCMVDAAVGGKNGVNFNTIKNLVGTFHDPAAVFIYADFLNSLPEEELKSGWGEVIKHGIIEDGDLWNIVLEGIPDIKDSKLWRQIIEENIRIKESVVQQDPRESGYRKILNMGHTIGHALESEYMKNGSYISHGHAVAVGLVVEAMIGQELKLTSNEATKQIKDAVAKVFPHPAIPDAWIAEMITSMQSDKKTINGNLHFSLPAEIGKIEPKVEVSVEIVHKAIVAYNVHAASL